MHTDAHTPFAHTHLRTGARSKAVLPRYFLDELIENPFSLALVIARVTASILTTATASVISLTRSQTAGYITSTHLQ